MARTEPPKMISVMMHDVLREDFEAWLKSRGLILSRFPDSMQDEPDLEAFCVMLSPERAEQFFGRGEPDGSATTGA